MIDTHAHIYMNHFKNDIDIILKRSIKKGINKILLPSVDYYSIFNIIKLTKKYPNICYPMVGLHPNYVLLNNFIDQLKYIEELIHTIHPIAIGEIGIDFNITDKLYFEQQYVFKKQVEIAKENNLPVIIHCRNINNTFKNILDILSHYKLKKGVFHCFCGDLEQAERIINIGMKLGIGGIITFKNNNLEKTIKKINIKNILLETDSPYLTPHPLRGTRNEPSNLTIIVEKLSEIYNISESEITNITNENAYDIFKI